MTERPHDAAPESGISRCPACGAPLGGGSLCRECGWDGALEHRRRPRRVRPAAWAARLLLWILPLLLVAGGLDRYRRTGPGPDLPTTLRWMAFGDGGRAAALATLGRAYEIARAASRYTVHELEPPSFEAGWARRLAPYATQAVRGWYPLLFVMADAGSAPASVRELFAVSPEDGWGRPWRIGLQTLRRGADPAAVPGAAEDLEAGLRANLFRQETPDLTAGDWLRLAIRSAGPDGRWDTGDDIALIAWIRAGRTFRIGAAGALEAAMERAYLQGPVLYRITGTRWDLVDTRILGEFRLDLLT